jgi:Uma2 family endonuclease
VVDYGVVYPIEFPKRMSDVDIEELSRRNPGLCFERTSRGELLVSPPAGWETSRSNVKLTTQLDAWNQRAGGGGEVFGPDGGFRLPDGTLFAPDAAWLGASRFALLRELEPRNKYAPVCPDLAFELASPSDRLPFIRRKIATYLRNGASCAILIDPEKRVVEVSYTDGRTDCLTGEPTLTVDAICSS